MQGVHIELADFSAPKQKLMLTIAKLALAESFGDLNLANVQCNDFVWGNNELQCKQGKAQIRSKRWRSPSARFTFRISEKNSTFSLEDLPVAGGHIAVNAVERGSQWQLRIRANGVQSRLLQKLLQRNLFDIKNGKINLLMQMDGQHTQLQNFNISAELAELTLQSKTGQFATEALQLSTHLLAENRKGIWRWRSQSLVAGGGLYADPVYLEAGAQTIALDAGGAWNPETSRADIESLRYHHGQTGELNGRATVRLDDGVIFEKADLSLSSESLPRLSTTYLKPFLEQSAWAGLAFNGDLSAHLAINGPSLTEASMSFNNLEVNDDAGHFDASGGSGSLYWASKASFSRPSQLAWRSLRLGALPIGAGSLSFLARDNTIRLLEKTRLPFSGGILAIKRFSWLAHKDQEPEVFFEGHLNEVSLEQLSKSLQWTPLSGTISGHIPAIAYRNKTLTLDGELLVRVFGGVVKIADLAVSELFSELPMLTAEIELDRLDMDQITRQFKFGGISGRLSGFIKNLTLENWKPVSFFAWLGTPENDDSSHRISQKAVNNIASIGGGGASDLISRSVLNLFETFGYDRLGLGCYLHNGVCQLMGLEAAHAGGYAIIKGGGLPRIDVIGYNPVVDWDVLIERLKRITTSDEVIIQ